jgi:hypothetical protein
MGPESLSWVPVKVLRTEVSYLIMYKGDIVLRASWKKKSYKQRTLNIQSNSVSCIARNRN